MVFTEREREYLAGQHLGRLSTIGPDGTPQTRPVGFRLNDDDTIDIGGPNLSSSQKYRNIKADNRVSFLVDDMTPDEPGALKPGWGRGVEIRGHAELLDVDEPPMGAGFFSNEVIRVHARRVIGLNLDSEGSHAHSA
jgi:pyridoxamine 5'-phosphate oxidase family protein